eukprot:15473933-Alexandrium_andersonii.AAC.1
MARPSRGPTTQPSHAVRGASREVAAKQTTAPSPMSRAPARPPHRAAQGLAGGRARGRPPPDH